ncbi:MAG: ABC transporter ATP-binding protein, partial [Gemmataceae bacterium]|nr:ABC transporter ATP-binding protein [Gemmataceae bacterium]
MIVEIDGLSRAFGRKKALDGATLHVPRGCVLGLVGVNGSGKTTLLRHVLGLYRPQAGTVRVFGLDPAADPPGVLSRVGFMSEEADLPDWMTVAELLRYTAAFYPSWDRGRAARMCDEFRLEAGQRVGSLSRGLRARAALVVALGHRPELLLLDEPSAGLDPLARRDILAAVVRETADEGRTVILSSHLLDEVERVADRVALMDTGRIAFHGPFDEVRAGHRRLTLRFAEPRAAPPALEGVLSWEGDGREWTAILRGDEAAAQALAGQAGAALVEDSAARFDEVFAARKKSNPKLQGVLKVRVKVT